MKTFKRIIYSFGVMATTALLLWSCANDYARTDITLEMTDEDSVDAIIDHDLLTVGGTIIHIEEPQESHTPIVEYVEEVDITTPEFDDDDISEEVAEVETDDDTVLAFDKDENDVMKSVEVDDDIISDDLDFNESDKIDDSIVADKPNLIETVVTDDITISDGEGSSVVLEEKDFGKKINDSKVDEPMKMNDIFVEQIDGTKKVNNGFTVPSDEEIAKLRNDVDALINKQGNKKSLDQFVSPVYNDKRIKISYPTHTVSRGDTFWSIGRKYGCTISELCAANNLSRRKVLSIGQSLIIPISNIEAAKMKSIPKNLPAAKDDLGMPPPVVDKPVAVKSSSVETKEYIVQKGDSYWKIARKYGVNSPELMRINNTSSSLIKPGQKIKVPKR